MGSLELDNDLNLDLVYRLIISSLIDAVERRTQKRREAEQRRRDKLLLMTSFFTIFRKKITITGLGQRRWNNLRLLTIPFFIDGNHFDKALRQ